MKNINELYKILSDEIDLLKAGKSNPARANALSNLTGKIFSGVRLQIEVAKLTGAQPRLDGMFITDGKAAKK